MPPSQGCSEGNNGSTSHYGKDLYAWDFPMPRGPGMAILEGSKAAAYIVDAFR